MNWHRTVRLVCPEFSVDVRLTHIGGRWIASADTPDGPSVGFGYLPTDALHMALAPFEGAVDDLLQSAPEIHHWR
jgi:hypothetical protein